ncbi:MAG: type II toxin-antitoxin system MqsA family antitoxin [Betaproteobacteria bacterium]|nr:type II toxin-antitoxin system MqsA family antitoxin [Betaproteobacteria bacterium]
MKCSLCKTGETHPGRTTVTLERTGCVVVIREVPAEICDNCGEYYLDEVTARRVYGNAEQGFERHVEVEIQRYAA